MSKPIITQKTIPYGRHSIDQQDIDAVIEALQSDYLTQGPLVSKFENLFADYVGAKYAVAVANATAGLHLSMLAVDLAPNQRIITTPITFVATANCIRYGQGEVWFADIDPNTYLLDINAVRRLLESKPKDFFTGIIPVDFAGMPIDLAQFRALADEYGLWIIEDACHAPGAYFLDDKKQKQRSGNGLFADASVFSFHPVKHIASGEGGMVTTNDPVIYRRLLRLRSHGINKKQPSSSIHFEMDDQPGDWYYEMKELGYNYRLTDLQSALGISQLTKNPKGLRLRNQIAEAYKKAFKDLLIANKIKYQNAIKTNNTPKFYNAYHLFVIEVPDRKALYDYLHKHGILAQVHYIPVHQMPYYRQFKHQGTDYKNAALNHAEQYYRQCLTLPLYPTLTKEEQEYVIEHVTEFLTQSDKTLFHE